MKTKIKTVICMAVAFVTAFLTTCTAFADTTGFDYYVGVYINSSGSGHISLSSNFLFYLVAYRDDENDCYVNASCGEGRLGAGKMGFYALFQYANKVDSNASLPPPGEREQFNDYVATGKVTKWIKTKIYSDQSENVYVK